MFANSLATTVLGLSERMAGRHRSTYRNSWVQINGGRFTHYIEHMPKPPVLYFDPQFFTTLYGMFGRYTCFAVYLYFLVINLNLLLTSASERHFRQF